MARKPCTWRKIFLWQEDPAPGGRFFCGKRVPRWARGLFVVRESRAGRKIFLWQEGPEPGGRFFCGKRVPNRVKTYNFFNFFFSVPPFSLLSLPFPVPPFSLLSLPFPVSPFSLLSLPFPVSPFPFFSLFSFPSFFLRFFTFCSQRL